MAYIEADRLLGVPFQAGSIRFYYMPKRTLAFELAVNVSGFYLRGLQYLPQK